MAKSRYQRTVAARTNRSSGAKATAQINQAGENLKAKAKARAAAGKSKGPMTRAEINRAREEMQETVRRRAKR